MFKNSKGKLVPLCNDCYYYDKEDCPDNALVDMVHEERGVLDCEAFKPRK